MTTDQKIYSVVCSILVVTIAILVFLLSKKFNILDFGYLIFLIIYLFRYVTLKNDDN
jgi:hypothetical protein